MMQYHTHFLFISILLLSLLSITRALPESPILNIIASSHGAASGGTSTGGASRPGLLQPGRKKPHKDGAGSDSTDDSSGHISEADVDTAKPESDIYHGPDGDAPAKCQNPLPEGVLFHVQPGHSCKELATVYNDTNTNDLFNCKNAR